MTTPTSKPSGARPYLNDNIHLRQQHLLKISQYAEQLRRIGLDLSNENSKLVGRVKALEQALEEERASVRLLKAVRDAGRWGQRKGDENEREERGKRKASLVVFEPSKKLRMVGMPEKVHEE